MKNTLLLRLCAPMQSWGTQSRFSIRDTGLEPSKSGVIGLLCASLGKPRKESHDNDEEFAALLALRMGVLVLREGVPKKDFQTAGGEHRQGIVYGVVNAKGEKGGTVTSTRHYLADADFLVGLEGENLEFLRHLETAVRNPYWQTFLGRKSFVPSLPVYVKDGLLENVSLEDALQPLEKINDKDFRRVLEVLINDPEATETRQDVPLSFAERRFTNRRVRTEIIDTKKGEENDGNLSNKDDFESAIAEGLE